MQNYTCFAYLKNAKNHKHANNNGKLSKNKKPRDACESDGMSQVGGDESH